MVKPKTTRWMRGNPHQAFARAKGRAKKKGLVFSLSDAAFFALFVKPCAYCKHAFDRGWGHGLDQKVPGAGYTKNNAVPCCWECNRIKSNKYTFEEMKKLGRTLSTIKKGRTK